MDLATLKAELADPRFAGLSDEDAAALFNAANLTEQRPIPSHDVRKLLHLRGRWAALRTASTVRGSPADELFDALDTFGTFDLGEQETLAVVGGVFDRLKADGLLTQQDIDAMLALGSHQVSRAVQLGWSPIHAGDVESARAVDADGQFPGHADRLAAAAARDAAWLAAKQQDASLRYDAWLPTYQPENG